MPNHRSPEYFSDKIFCLQAQQFYYNSPPWRLEQRPDYIDFLLHGLGLPRHAVPYQPPSVVSRGVRISEISIRGLSAYAEPAQTTTGGRGAQWGEKAPHGSVRPYMVIYNCKGLTEVKGPAEEKRGPKR